MIHWIFLFKKYFCDPTAWVFLMKDKVHFLPNAEVAVEQSVNFRAAFSFFFFF